MIAYDCVHVTYVCRQPVAVIKLPARLFSGILYKATSIFPIETTPSSSVLNLIHQFINIAYVYIYMHICIIILITIHMCICNHIKYHILYIIYYIIYINIYIYVCIFDMCMLVNLLTQNSKMTNMTSSPRH